MPTHKRTVFPSPPSPRPCYARTKQTARRHNNVANYTGTSQQPPQPVAGAEASTSEEENSPEDGVVKEGGVNNPKK